MFNRKFMLFIILLISLLAVSAVGASEDADGEIIGHDADSQVISQDVGSEVVNQADESEAAGQDVGSDVVAQADESEAVGQDVGGDVVAQADESEAVGQADDGEAVAQNGESQIVASDFGDYKDGTVKKSISEKSDDVVSQKADSPVLASTSDFRDANSKSAGKIKATIKPTKLTTSYGSGKYLKIKVSDSSTKKPVANAKLLLAFYKSNKLYKTILVKTNYQGMVKYAVSKLNIGKNKIVVKSYSSNVVAKSKTTYVKIIKAALKVYAPKVTNGYKSGKFKVTVKNKKTGNKIGNVKVRIKVYTGKKYKTYTVKTNSNGVASISTKSLSKGTHKVVVSVKGTSKYKSASKKSSIKVISVVKLATHFRLNDLHVKIYAGELDSIDADVDLIDQNGNKINRKVVSAQLFGLYTRFDLITQFSDVQKQALTNNIHIDSNRGDEIGSIYLEVKFAGDSKYKTCTAQFKPTSYTVYFDSNTGYSGTGDFFDTHNL